MSFLDNKLKPSLLFVLDKSIDAFKDQKDGLTEIRNSFEINNRDSSTSFITQAKCEYFTRTSGWKYINIAGKW